MAQKGQTFLGCLCKIFVAPLPVFGIIGTLKPTHLAVLRRGAFSFYSDNASKNQMVKNLTDNGGYVMSVDNILLTYSQKKAIL